MCNNSVTNIYMKPFGYTKYSLQELLKTLISRIDKMLLNISVNLPFVIFMENLNELTAISPVDGRYRKTCAPFGDYFSEFALIKYRVFVELEWFKRLFQE